MGSTGSDTETLIERLRERAMDPQLAYRSTFDTAHLLERAAAALAAEKERADRWETDFNAERAWREAQVAALREALERTRAIQPATLERLRTEGVVFDRAPGPDKSWDDWQHIAFWIYTELCEIEQIAREALA